MDIKFSKIFWIPLYMFSDDYEGLRLTTDL